MGQLSNGMSNTRREPPTTTPDTSERSPLLRCHKLVLGYGGVPLLPPIDFTLHVAELCAVVGRNGAGKTSWFRTVLGLLPPVSGLIEHCGGPIPMGYIPQRVQMEPILPLCAWDIAAMGLDRGRSYLVPWLGRRERRRVNQALEQMNALELKRERFGSLSEGQKQRVLMARLLTGRPKLAVLDEPTAAMDQIAERETLDLVSQLCHLHGMSVLIVSHQLPAVARIADRVVFLDRSSQTVVQGPPAAVSVHPAFRAQYGLANTAAPDSPLATSSAPPMH